MRKWRLEIWTDKCDWEYLGLFETYEKARDEGREVLRCWSIARDFAVNPVEIPDNEPDEDDAMNPKDINFNVNVNFADSMDQSCPGEIHAHGFPADDPKAKQEYEKAAKDFCIDNLGAFDK
ncbi:TPA: hypothetical protein PPE20_001418 [Escherichia coli]|nr:hypothetical protein [Escherichia coli]